jgi:hypothetical protein
LIVRWIRKINLVQRVFGKDKKERFYFEKRKGIGKKNRKTSFR